MSKGIPVIRIERAAASSPDSVTCRTRSADRHRAGVVARAAHGGSHSRRARCARPIPLLNPAAVPVADLLVAVAVAQVVPEGHLRRGLRSVIGAMTQEQAFRPRLVFRRRLQWLQCRLAARSVLALGIGFLDQLSNGGARRVRQRSHLHVTHLGTSALQQAMRICQAGAPEEPEIDP